MSGKQQEQEKRLGTLRSQPLAIGPRLRTTLRQAAVGSSGETDEPSSWP